MLCSQSVVYSGYQKSERKMEDEWTKTTAIVVENNGKTDEVVKSSVKDVRKHSASVPGPGTSRSTNSKFRRAAGQAKS
ncbi:unnamed protein product [Thelazia callipaeda]|uniref:Ovule protein n=1 Tax=Thelazia callipaeda TaxID=103827 RepID=A0A0N5D1F5_THECL|nr:unnamed protein product [Thelazia callipaeda]